MALLQEVDFCLEASRVHRFGSSLERPTNQATMRTSPMEMYGPLRSRVLASAQFSSIVMLLRVIRK